MRRLPAVFTAAFILLAAFGIGAWQSSQQNFGSGLPGGLFYTPPTLTVSSVGNGNGTLSLAGNTSGTATLAAPAVAGTATNPMLISNSLQFPSGTAINWNNDTGLSRDAAATIDVGNGTAGNKTGTINLATLTATTAVNGAAFQTATNCASTGGTCGSAASGSVGITNPATTVTVSTTAVTANSVIIVQEDSTLGTKLTATCNATLGRTFMVTTRTPGASFIITASATPAANTACLNYWIVN